MPTPSAAPPVATNRNPAVLHALLWAVQIVLCLLYLYTGEMKLVMLPGAVRGAIPLLYPFLGLCEFLGALGMILPSALRIKPGLTPIAAGGLTIIMIGAIHALMVSGPHTLIWLPIAALVGDLFVLIGRTWLAPIRGR
ncbi:MAG: DoxX family protein [Terriglobales bacterium]